jgi:hypothetical protein
MLELGFDMPFPLGAATRPAGEYCIDQRISLGDTVRMPPGKAYPKVTSLT